MKTGRPNKSIEQHKRDGTLGTRQKAKSPLLVSGREKPECPKYLTKDAKNAFKFIVDELWDSGIIDRADAPLIITAAGFWGSAIQASKDIKKKGQVVEVTRGARDGSPGYQVREKNPSVQIYHEALAHFRQCCDLLGIGPSARARLAGMGIKTKEPAKEIPGLGELRAIRGGKDV